MFHLNRLLIFILLLLLFSCSGNKKEEIVIEEKDLEMQMIEAYEAGVEAFEGGDTIFAAKNFKVNLIDKNKVFLDKINKGIPPFLEKGSKKLLEKCLKKKIVAKSNFID